MHREPGCVLGGCFWLLLHGRVCCALGGSVVHECVIPEVVLRIVMHEKYYLSGYIQKAVGTNVDQLSKYFH